MTLAIDGVGSHMPVLAAMVAKTAPNEADVFYGTPRDVVEYGMGDFSTPLLHMMCVAQRRPLCSMDTDTQWCYKFAAMRGDYHRIINVDNWDDCGGLSFPYGLAFVDCAPGEARVPLIHRIRKMVDFIIVHDAEDSPAANYGFAKCFASFKYVWKWGACNVDTAVLSDRYPIPLEGL